MADTAMHPEAPQNGTAAEVQEENAAVEQDATVEQDDVDMAAAEEEQGEAEKGKEGEEEKKKEKKQAKAVGEGRKKEKDGLVTAAAAAAVAEADEEEGTVEEEEDGGRQKGVQEEVEGAVVEQEEEAEKEKEKEGKALVPVDEGKPTKKRPGRPKKVRAPGEVEVVKEKKEPKMTTPRKEGGGRAKKEPKEVPSYAADRPTRERKHIERFIASTDKDKNKELQIKQGDGTVLKDIPNVVYKLSKISKHDEVLGMLHSLCFNKRGKATVLKHHILQFSGYVWSENQEKEKARVREKLERYTKEGLVSLVDVLDIHISRAVKKEELVAKVLEFLEKPHKTTDILLGQKELERKSSGKRSSSSGNKPGRPKIQRVEGKSSRKRERKTTEDGASDESGKDSDNESLEEEIEQKRLTFKDDTDQEEESGEEEKKPAKRSGKKSSKQESEEPAEEVEGYDDDEESAPSRKKAKVASQDTPMKSPSKPVDKVYSKKKSHEEEPKVTPAKKGPGRPKKSLEDSGKKDSTKVKKATPKKSTSATKEKDTGTKSKGKGSKQKANKIPSDEELQEKIRDLLKVSDFSKVTFTDVVSQLETIFQVTLVEQKSHVKRLIREEISKLTEEEPDSPEQDVGAVETGNDDKEEEEQDTSKVTEEEIKEDAEQPAEEAVGGD